MKKICAVLLSAALLFAILPMGMFSVSAAASGKCGNNLTWSYNTSTATLTISGTGTMTDYSSLNIGNYTSVYVTNAPWQSYYNTMKTVVIENGVTTIGYSAFRGCTGLTSITIPDSVTTIGEQAFDGCTGLTSVTIGNSVTTIGDYAFYDCTGLTSITIGNSVTTIGYRAFYGCTGLTGVYITDVAAWCSISFDRNAYDIDFTTSNPLEYAHNLYLNGELVTDLVIPQGVTEIKEHAFYDCTGLTSITIPDSVTTIGDGAFSGCTGLTDISWNAKAVADFSSYSSVFYNAGTAGVGITVSFGDSVENIPEDLFYVSDSSYRPNVKSVIIGNSVTTIGSSAFYECYNLTSITIPDSVTSIGDYAFEDCTGLTGVYINDVAAWCNISFDSYSANPLRYAYNLYLNDELVTDLVIPQSVTEIKKYAFFYCTSLTSVTIPDSVTTIGNSAFEDCTGLTSITIPESVTTIGYDAFSGCTGLTEVYITDVAAWCNISFGYKPLYYAHNLYLNGELVTDLVIPQGVTEIKDYVFDNCTSLTSVTIPDSVTTIGGYAFYNCPVTIYGEAGSYAERYAAANGYTFVPKPVKMKVFSVPDKVVYNVGE
ncbi:MAG: leucine-rich repeat domain-containing protein, partial [Clostridia bacterium]|nr:leucine-rich repeat domain-containing protein [Clostridia bacterium]